MRIQFDDHQGFQLEAIRAVVDVFDGQPLAQGQYEVSLGRVGGALLDELGQGNVLALPEEALLRNLKAVQGPTSLPVSVRLEGLNFTVETEGLWRIHHCIHRS